MQLQDLQNTTYINTSQLPALWKAYIKQIREKGHRTGILGDAQDMKILDVLLPRIKRNLDKMPAQIQNTFATYGKTTRKYKTVENPKSEKLNGRITKRMKEELQRIAKGQGIGMSTLVGNIIEQYLSNDLLK